MCVARNHDKGYLLSLAVGHHVDARLIFPFGHGQHGIQTVEGTALLGIAYHIGHVAEWRYGLAWLALRYAFGILHQRDALADARLQVQVVGRRCTALGAVVEYDILFGQCLGGLYQCIVCLGDALWTMGGR